MVGSFRLSAYSGEPNSQLQLFPTYPTTHLYLVLANVSRSLSIVEAMRMTSTEYLAGIMAEPALFQSGSTPVYSNNAFVLLAIALENITGEDLANIFNESLVEVHDLPETIFDVPSSNQNGVIPGDPTSSGWNSRLGAFAA